jgi:hypothetical protein
MNARVLVHIFVLITLATLVGLGTALADRDATPAVAFETTVHAGAWLRPGE